MNKRIKSKLEYLRQQLRQECISYYEIMELESLKDYIDKSDIELLEAIGIPEYE